MQEKKPTIPVLAVLKRKLQLALNILEQHECIKFWHSLHKKTVWQFVRTCEMNMFRVARCNLFLATAVKSVIPRLSALANPCQPSGLCTDPSVSVAVANRIKTKLIMISQIKFGNHQT